MFHLTPAVPFLTVALPHDWHHYYTNENFGAIGLLDGIFKTDTVYKAWIANVQSEFELTVAKTADKRVMYHEVAAEILNRYEDEKEAAEGDMDGGQVVGKN
jgi:sterol desaturase/sphingolipid hydroxylase (fatty acid hydroxylase superfamily)